MYFKLCWENTCLSGMGSCQPSFGDLDIRLHIQPGMPVPFLPVHGLHADMVLANVTSTIYQPGDIWL